MNRGRPLPFAISSQWAGNYGWGRGRERQDYSEDYGGHDWEPPAYEWRQQSYPWGHQGQEGYFGWGEQDYDREWQGSSHGFQGRDWGRPGYGRERQGPPWSPGWPTLSRPRQVFPWQRQETEWIYGGPEWEGVSGPYAGRGPKGYQRTDERIREDVCERLTQHPAIDAGEIEVEVKQCEVTLTGTVDSRAIKHLAEDMAETVSGVKDIHNQLRVVQGARTQRC